MRTGTGMRAVDAPDGEGSVAADLQEQARRTVHSGDHDWQRIITAGIGRCLIDGPIEVAPPLSVIASRPTPLDAALACTRVGASATRVANADAVSVIAWAIAVKRGRHRDDEFGFSH
jgi:hypothetical protein